MENVHVINVDMYTSKQKLSENQDWCRSFTSDHQKTFAQVGNPFGKHA